MLPYGSMNCVRCEGSACSPLSPPSGSPSNKVSLAEHMPQVKAFFEGNEIYRKILEKSNFPIRLKKC
jgi:hypothetical protein